MEQRNGLCSTKWKKKRVTARIKAIKVGQRVRPGQALLALVPLHGEQRRRTELGGQRPPNTFVQLLYGEVQRQALLMAFVAAFRLVALIFFLLIPPVFLMRRPRILGGI
jgi:hypothetical protein